MVITLISHGNSEVKKTTLGPNAKMCTLSFEVYPKLLVHVGMVNRHFSGPHLTPKLSFQFLVYLLVCLTP